MSTIGAGELAVRQHDLYPVLDHFAAVVENHSGTYQWDTTYPGQQPLDISLIAGDVHHGCNVRGYDSGTAERYLRGMRSVVRSRAETVRVSDSSIQTTTVRLTGVGDHRSRANPDDPRQQLPSLGITFTRDRKSGLYTSCGVQANMVPLGAGDDRDELGDVLSLPPDILSVAGDLDALKEQPNPHDVAKLEKMTAVAIAVSRLVF